jgi:uncharacterized protein YciU (UPF0263 family)
LSRVKISLNDDQQAILEWLKNTHKDTDDILETLYDLYVDTAPADFKTCLMATYEKLDKRQLAEVVQAFCDWELTQMVEEGDD